MSEISEISAFLGFGSMDSLSGKNEPLMGVRDILEVKASSEEDPIKEVYLQFSWSFDQGIRELIESKLVEPNSSNK